MKKRVDYGFCKIAVKNALKIQAEEKDKELAVVCSEWKDTMNDALRVQDRKNKSSIRKQVAKLKDRIKDGVGIDGKSTMKIDDVLQFIDKDMQRFLK